MAGIWQDVSVLTVETWAFIKLVVCIIFNISAYTTIRRDDMVVTSSYGAFEFHKVCVATMKEAKKFCVQEPL